MSELKVTKIRLRHGVWEGRVDGAGRTGARPEIAVMYLDRPVPGVELSPADQPGAWDLRIPVPADAIADGIQAFVIFNGESGRKLGDFTLIAGDTHPSDLRAEVELLRAELDMLKRAFRRHCLETM